MPRWFEIRAAAEGAEVVIYDAIGGFGLSAKAFTDELKRFAAAPVLQLRINSPGGDVFEGLAIHNALARHPARKLVTIDGLAASIASVVAMAGDEIVMPANAMLMLHDPSAAVVGRAQELRQMADGLDRIRAAMASIYARRSQREPHAIGRLMDAETWLSAGEAVALGLADRLDPPVRMAAHFDLSVFANAPPALTTNAPPALAALSHPRPTTKEQLTMADDPDREPGSGAFPAPISKPSPSTPAPAAATDIEAVTAAARAPTPEPPSSTAAPAAATDIEAVTAAARAEALAYATQVTELCVLARMPERASAFIAANAPLAEVGRALLKARAETDADEIVAIQPAALRAKDHGWGPVIESRFGKRSCAAMTILSEGNHAAAFLVSEAAGTRARERITVSSGESLVAGAVLGKVTLGAATPAPFPGNAANTGTIATLSLGAGAKAGVYRLVIIEPASNAGAFTLEDPDGVTIGTGTVGVEFTAAGLTVTLADGATDFKAGEGFTLTVAAGSGKYRGYHPANTDGSQAAVAVLFAAVDAATADQLGIAVVRDAEVNAAELSWFAGATAEQKATGLAQLAGAGIIAR